MSIVDNIKNEIMLLNEKYMAEAEDKDNFWDEHIKHVVRQAVILAERYDADAEIVELAALLHDVALIAKEGTRKEHHATGAQIAGAMLAKYGYPKEKADKVAKSVFNHRSGKNATDIEDICVADGDILAHFDNISMLFCAFLNAVWSGEGKERVTLPELRSQMRQAFEKDYNDLSERTKRHFGERYKMICQIVLGA